MTHIRKAGSLDAVHMANLLNAIIRKGGTTALTKEVSGQDIIDFIIHYSGANAWIIAEDDNGTLLGFQYIEPKETLPPEAADIATFVKVGQTGLGIGSKLFERTKIEARSLGYAWINATIRCDNSGGLAYYQSRGFEDYRKETGVRLADGTIVDRLLKRFNL